MLNFKSYNPHHLHACRALVHAAAEQGVDLSALVAMLDIWAADRASTAAVSQSRTRPDNTCPSCGRESLQQIATIDGLRRVGCRRCYYSEVLI